MSCAGRALESGGGQVAAPAGQQAQRACSSQLQAVIAVTQVLLARPHRGRKHVVPSLPPCEQSRFAAALMQPLGYKLRCLPRSDLHCHPAQPCKARRRTALRRLDQLWGGACFTGIGCRSHASRAATGPGSGAESSRGRPPLPGVAKPQRHAPVAAAWHAPPSAIKRPPAGQMPHGEESSRDQLACHVPSDQLPGRSAVIV